MKQQRVLAPFTASLVCWLIAGCVAESPLPVPGLESSNESGQAASLHAVMSEQLNLNNDRLQVLLFDLHRTETELARERAALLTRIGKVAGNLREGAARIPKQSSSLTLSAADTVRFNALAHRLESQAGNLATLADTGQLQTDRMADYLDSINATCDSCHTLYRDPAYGRR